MISYGIFHSIIEQLWRDAYMLKDAYISRIITVLGCTFTRGSTWKIYPPGGLRILNKYIHKLCRSTTVWKMACSRITKIIYCIKIFSKSLVKPLHNLISISSYDIPQSGISISTSLILKTPKAKSLDSMQLRRCIKLKLIQQIKIYILYVKMLEKKKNSLWYHNSHLPTPKSQLSASPSTLRPPAMHQRWTRNNTKSASEIEISNTVWNFQQESTLKNF